MLLRDMPKDQRLVNIKGRYMVAMENIALDYAQMEKKVDEDIIIHTYRELLKHLDEVDYNFSLESVESLSKEIFNRLVAESEAEEDDDESGYYSHIEGQIQELGEKVVRLVFLKKDGSVRVMWATRNPDLVKTYCTKAYTTGMVDNIDSEDAVSAQIAGDYVKVLDLEKKEFRTYKPSNLILGKVGGYPAWITSDKDSDAWYNIVYSGHDLDDYLEGNRLKMVKNAPERRLTELRSKLIAVTNGVEVDDETGGYIRELSKELKNILSMYKHKVQTMTLSDEYEDLTTSGTFESEVKDLLVNMSSMGGLEVGKRPKSLGDNTYEIIVKTDTVVINPYFIVNKRTGKVYLDRFSLIRNKVRELKNKYELGKTLIDTQDKKMAGFIDDFIDRNNLRTLKVTNGSRRVKKVDPRFVERQERLHLLTNERNGAAKQFLYYNNVSLMPVQGSNLVRVKANTGGTEYALVSPNKLVIYYKDQGEYVEACRMELTNSNRLLSSWKEYIASKRYDLHKFSQLLDVLDEFIVDQVLDLRKKIKLDNK